MLLFSSIVSIQAQIYRVWCWAISSNHLVVNLVIINYCCAEVVCDDVLVRWPDWVIEWEVWLCWNKSSQLGFSTGWTTSSIVSVAEGHSDGNCCLRISSSWWCCCSCRWCRAWNNYRLSADAWSRCVIDGRLCCHSVIVQAFSQFCLCVCVRDDVSMKCVLILYLGEFSPNFCQQCDV